MRTLGLGLALLGALVASAFGGAREPTAPAGDFTLELARRFAEFPLYYAGERAEGLPLVAVLRRDDTADYVSFVYGDCVPRAPDSACAPPVEIQVWPACRRNLGLYEAATSRSVSLETTTFRGVPAAWLDGGGRLELQTGTSTVVVFAGTRARALRVGASLRPLGSGPISSTLPPPVAGALEGALRC